MSDEELVAKAIHDVDCPDVPHCMATPTTWSRYHRFAAASVAALSGRLLPEGGEERTEWAVWWHAGDSDWIALSEYHLPSRPAAEQVGQTRIGDYGITRFTIHTRVHRVFRDGSSYVGPWSEVTE